MAMMRMSMGQKHAAKKVTKMAFAEPGDVRNTPVDTVRRSSSSGVSHHSTRSSSFWSPEAPKDWQGELNQPSLKSQATRRVTPDFNDAAVERIRRGNTSGILVADTGVTPFQKHFNMVMGVIIILNTLLIAVETDVGYDESGGFQEQIGWIVVDAVFALTFVLEIFLRMYWEGLVQWTRSAWNWVDVVIVLFAVVDLLVLTWMSDEMGDLQFVTIFRIVRLVRLVRLVKLVRLLKGLYIILMAFWHAMQTMSFLLAMMFFGLMVYAVLAVNLIGRNSSLKHVRINNGDTVEDRFGTVFKSMYSLFELMTLEGWEQVARPIVSEQPFLFIYMASFIMIFTFGMLNMVVAVVIEKTLHHTRLMGEEEAISERQHMAEELLRISQVFSEGDSKAHAGRPGVITFQEFETSLRENGCVQTTLSRMGVMEKEAKELYQVLDWDESGELTVDELLEGLGKLQEGVCSAWDSMATHSLTRSTRNKVAVLQDAVSRLAQDQERFALEQSDQRQRLSRIERSMESNTEILKHIASNMGEMRRQDSGISSIDSIYDLPVLVRTQTGGLPGLSSESTLGSL